MHFFHDSRVSSVLEYPKRFTGQALLMYVIYTPVLRAVLPCSRKKITIFRDAPLLTHRPH
ncbi:MAG: hypothetical protein ACI9KN_002295 [Gammaproteobacteria bacterium]|jgi:hypothetical protein